MSAGAEFNYQHLDLAAERGSVCAVKEILSVKPDLVYEDNVCEIFLVVRIDFIFFVFGIVFELPILT